MQLPYTLEHSSACDRAKRQYKKGGVSREWFLNRQCKDCYSSIYQVVLEAMKLDPKVEAAIDKIYGPKGE